MTDREERQRVIEVLQEMVDWMQAAHYIVSKPERIHALFYAIASIKTDLKYDLLYEETSGQADKQADKTTTKNDLEIVMDAMEYRTNALIENIKSEIMHFANAHCSGDDINIYDVFKVIDDCCEAENSTTKNDLALIHTEGLDEEIRCTMCTNHMKSDRGCDGGCVVNNAMYKKVMDVIENHIVDTNKMIEPTTKNDLVVDCISRADAIKGLGEQPYVWTDSDYEIQQLTDWKNHKEMLENLPSVTPQEPRKGHWIGHREHCENLGVMPSGLGAYEWCSNCDCGIDVREWHRNHYNFCPNCGADMREVVEE